MPIGTIIGWLIGQTLIGIAMAVTNGSPKYNITPASALLRQTMSVIGTFLTMTGLAALGGTFIEMLAT